MSRLTSKPKEFIRCDFYNCTNIRLAPGFGLPDGWTEVTIHDCGLTGYTREEHRCPKHSEKGGESP